MLLPYYVLFVSLYVGSYSSFKSLRAGSQEFALLMSFLCSCILCGRVRACSCYMLSLSAISMMYIYNIYYRFIVRFPIGLDFLFITFTFLLNFLLSWTSSLSISCSAISASTLSNHVFLGFPTGLLTSTLYSIHFVT